MRKFKELVSYFDYDSIDYEDSDIHSIIIKANKKLMPGMVVRLTDDGIIIPTEDSKYDVLGVIIENDNSEYHCVATCGTVICICKSGNYKKGDYLKTCDIYGAGSKFISHRGFNIPENHKQNICFAIVEEDRDLRTTHMGYVKVKLLGKYPCTICSIKSI